MTMGAQSEGFRIVTPELPFVYAIALPAERVVVIRMQLDASAGYAKRPGCPVRGQPEDSFALFQDPRHCVLVGHSRFFYR